MVHFFFGIDGNSQKLITSNDTCLTIAVADLIISERLPFNISKKKIQEGTGVTKESFQDIYASQQKFHIQRTI